jgi:iron complex outermembrane receptor protein
LHAPITDGLELQLAARYEDYGTGIGSTFNPKASVRWQLMHDFALRASAGSTFRGPSLTSTTNGSITSLQNVLGTFRAVDIFGNPALKPETAKNYSLGAIYNNRRAFVTLDYWRFDFDNPIVTEPLAGMVNTLFPNGLAAPNNCNLAPYAALQARFTFNGGVCGPANIIRVHTDNINGPAIQNSGVDFVARYDFDGGFYGGSFSVGTAVTYVLEDKVGATTVEGLLVQPAFESTGKLNYQTQVYPVPRIRGNAYIEWGGPEQNLRLAMNYVDGYKDQRTDPYNGSAATCAPPAAGGLTGCTPLIISDGKNIGSFITYDLNYRHDLGPNSTFTAGVENLTDQAPPFARLDLNYDPFTASALGRVIHVGLRQRF